MSRRGSPRLTALPGHIWFSLPIQSLPLSPRSMAEVAADVAVGAAVDPAEEVEVPAVVLAGVAAVAAELVGARAAAAARADRLAVLLAAEVVAAE